MSSDQAEEDWMTIFGHNNFWSARIWEYLAEAINDDTGFGRLNGYNLKPL